MPKKPKSNKNQDRDSSFSKGHQTQAQDPIDTNSKHFNFLNTKLELDQTIFLVIGILIFLIGISIRFFAFNAIILGDEAVYATLGKKLFSGYTPFVDFYEMKPPLLYFVYGLGMQIFSWSIEGIRLFGLAGVLVNCVLIFFIGKKYLHWTQSFFLSAIAFFLMQNVFAYAVEAVSEHFLMNFILSGIFFLSMKPLKSSSINLILAGFLLMGGMMIKQSAGIFGLLAGIILISRHYREFKFNNLKKLISEIAFLGLGSIIMILANILPILIYGSFDEMRYWVVEFPGKYVSTINFIDGLTFLQAYFGRIFNYMPFTLSFIAVLNVVQIFLIRSKYWITLIGMTLAAMLFVLPGFRYYGQYWIPLLLISTLSAGSSIKVLADRYSHLKAGIIIPIAFFLAVFTDVVRKSNYYYNDTYRLNTEHAHSGNYPTAVNEIVKDLEKRMDPDDSFIMLGTEVYTYVSLGKFPEHKHIYPKMIGTKSEMNTQFQREAYESFVNGNYDYLIFSITPNGWSVSKEFDDWLYQRCFSYVRRNYEPIMAFNTDERKFYQEGVGNGVDIYRSNQFVSFKRIGI